MANKNSITHIMRQLAPFMSLLIMALILSFASPYFLTVDNLFAIGLQMAVVAIMAIGQMMIIISAGIDLSVGSVMALSGVGTTMLMAQQLPIFPAILIGLFIGALCGALAGALIAWGHIPPFIATLGIMGIARGIALLVTKGVPVFGLPEKFNFLGGGRVFGVLPVPVLFVIVLAVIFHIFLTRTVFGRHIFALGSNPEAARLSGVDVAMKLFKLYIINGVLCGFAGIVMASRLSTGQPTAGTGYELDVIAACVIGGASLSGGEGTILGAMTGALIMGVLRNGCNLLNISAFWQQIAIGAIIIIAVFSDQYRKHKSGRF
ncbi:MAG TPA: ABC transporter permease [bacterium]|nr:ABC transporter permease [bacterium]HPN45212.1 ABC transporter permease [bacterium]